MSRDVFEALDGFQTSATDAEQQAYAERKAKQLSAREHELWRWLLSQKMGREFLHRVLFKHLGVQRYIESVRTDLLYGDVALHNLACRLMGEFIVVHRDLYLQSVAEETKRDDDERNELATMRARWAAQEEEANNA